MVNGSPVIGAAGVPEGINGIHPVITRIRRQRLNMPGCGAMFSP